MRKWSTLGSCRWKVRREITGWRARSARAGRTVADHSGLHRAGRDRARDQLRIRLQAPRVSHGHLDDHRDPNAELFEHDNDPSGKRNHATSRQCGLPGRSRADNLVGATSDDSATTERPTAHQPTANHETGHPANHRTANHRPAPTQGDQRPIRTDGDPLPRRGVLHRRGRGMDHGERNDC